MEHNETIRKEFSRQAASFGDKGLTLSSQEYLEWMVDILPLEPDSRVLDVAAGTGHLSRAIAPRVGQVVAIDMTPEMLAEARKSADEAGLDNITFEEGDAAALPYDDDSFDMVVSRLAIHHFETPAAQLVEMVRVCKPGHVIGIIDLVSPSDESVFETYNRLERMRDTSHTVALTKEQLTAAMEAAGIAVEGIDTRALPVDFERWSVMTGTLPDTKAAIRAELEAEIAGGTPTGMQPYAEDGELKFIHTWAVVIGTAPAES